MATYKVIQDIEAEDKILGPLTLRQFIFALVMSFFLYLSFIVVAKGAPFLLVVFLPPALLAAFFAFPFGRDQPTEIWAVAKISFLFKPRKRIWDQSGIKELVTVTVPKKIERVYTNGLSQTEVRSRLSALASTIDTRGWAIKNVNVNMYAEQAGAIVNDSDRLVAMSSMPQAVPDYFVSAADDMLDVQSNPIAQQFTQMISASEQAHRQHLIDEMNRVTPIATGQAQQPVAAPVVENLWFTQGQQLQTAAEPTAQELALLDQIKAENSTEQTSYSHLKTIQPLSVAGPEAPAQLNPVSLDAVFNAPEQADFMAPVALPEPTPAAAAVVAPTPQPDATIQNLARSNDLNIATLAREAHKAKPNDDPVQGEVIISLR